MFDFLKSSCHYKEVNRISKLAFAIVVCEGVGILGSVFTISQIPVWYVSLNKPIFSPPNWIFGPVWIVLYALMGISIVLALEKSAKKNKHFIYKIFGIQLFLNFLWTVIFFGVHETRLAFVEILVLWVIILYLIIIFNKISKVASYLLIPYLLWVSFAALLNFWIAILN